MHRRVCVAASAHAKYIVAYFDRKTIKCSKVTHKIEAAYSHSNSITSSDVARLCRMITVDTLGAVSGLCVCVCVSHAARRRADGEVMCSEMVDDTSQRAVYFYFTFGFITVAVPFVYHTHAP